MAKRALSAVKLTVATSHLQLREKHAAVKSIADQLRADCDVTKHSLRNRALLIAVFVIVVTSTVTNHFGQSLVAGYYRLFHAIDDYYEEDCAIAVPRVARDAFLPAFNCSICAGLRNVTKVSNISQEDFVNT